MFSLRWKLGGALLLVVLVSVGVMAYLTNRNTEAQFQQYLQGGGMMYTQRLSDNLERYYTQNKSWAGVQEILDASLRSTNERLVLADSSGKIVGDTSNEWLGKSSGELKLNNGIAITSSGQNAGTLYSYFSGTAPGRGYMGGMGMMGTSPTTIVNPESDFLSRVNSYLWLAGLIAAAIALILGILLTRQITRPVHALNLGAQHISQGDLAYRVKAYSGDELGRLARSFNAMAASLDSSEQSRRRLVSDVAHELRTPLTIIEGTADGIIDGVFPPDREHLNVIKEQTAALTRLVTDLREISMAESGQLKLDYAPTDIVSLLKHKLSQFEVVAKSKNIQLKLDTPSAIPEISIDSRRIEQVVANLLANAIRHTSGGNITVSVKMIPSDTTHGVLKPSLLVSVADTGEGIAPEHLPHLFERFYRVESSRSRGEGGAGLGLAIVKQLVQAHGGEVWVESRTGKGSTFFFTLPAGNKLG
ncbi:MAG: ATP-binding protein [Dehalococcoidales bacterium]|nr:ATP-binding protein [Dehalococcoidales bacterium]